MKKEILISIRILGVMILLLGLFYPLAVTGVAQLIFPKQANGSLITVNGMVVGSELIGQEFGDSLYFSSRPSATGYNTLPSGASNQGLISSELRHQVKERETKFRLENMLKSTDVIPAEMLFASGSGLDPHISPEAALMQMERVASNRKFSMEQKQILLSMIERLAQKPQFMILGSSRINVLMLNIELDKIK